MAVNRRHTFLAGLPTPSIPRLSLISMWPPRRPWRSWRLFPALFLMDRPKFAATVRPYPPSQKPVTAKNPSVGVSGFDQPPGYYGDLGNFPAGRAVAFASLARPDLTLWHKITWNPWTACNWVYADIKSGFSRNARYWPPETAPCRLQPLRETGAKPSGTVGPRCVGETSRIIDERASKDCRLLRPNTGGLD